MIKDVLKDYFEDTPDTDTQRMDSLETILKKYDAEYLSGIDDTEKRYAYLAAFLCRLDRLPDFELADPETVFQNEDIRLYLEMDETEKRIDALPFQRNTALMKKADGIRLHILRIAIEKLKGYTAAEDTGSVLYYRQQLEMMRNDLPSLSFSLRRKTEQLISGSLIDIAFILGESRQCSAELREYYTRYVQP